MVSSYWVYGNYNDNTYEVIRYYNVVSKILVGLLKLLIKIVFVVFTLVHNLRGMIV